MTTGREQRLRKNATNAGKVLWKALRATPHPPTPDGAGPSLSHKGRGILGRELFEVTT